MRELILGGARSGKSRYAQARATEWALPVRYIATAESLDHEMAQRISRHRQDRPEHWEVYEESIALGALLKDSIAPDRVVLVDCLTLWLSNLLCLNDHNRFAQERQALLDALAEPVGPVILVSNEVGQGVIPDNALARQFVDATGWLHQALAEQCERVSLVVAGLPLTLKS
ncbi:MAG: bifunctional adenosylcobinamide kinase/adenosylcobinamide-phosphate guanylyltransferase [Hahellaceae bacterium]|nr:bifunctional adenosylcobinamide kinase/adenosylcobinamide-phosphate guanylyltransferase [Hahellaceae bacterium]MCP5169136.1 bifunctional adenosylcobinamide kinase/adenosylcobinamide-phosphate guanylyltransferase [Hahellaceae bacterium]